MQGVTAWHAHATGLVYAEGYSRPPGPPPRAIARFVVASVECSSKNLWQFALETGVLGGGLAGEQWKRPHAYMSERPFPS